MRIVSILICALLTIPAFAGIPEKREESKEQASGQCYSMLRQAVRKVKEKK